MFRSVGRRVVGVVVAASLYVVAAGCSGASSNGAESIRDNIPDNAVGLPESSDPILDAGRQLIETKCSTCHELDRVKQAEKDRAAWETTIAQMRQNGLVITDQEVEQILDYLDSR